MKALDGVVTQVHRVVLRVDHFRADVHQVEDQGEAFYKRRSIRNIHSDLNNILDTYY